MTIVEDTPENMSSTTAKRQRSDIEDTLYRAPEKRHYVDGGVMCPVGLLLQVGTVPVVISGA